MGEGNKENRSRIIADRLKNIRRAEYMFVPYNLKYYSILNVNMMYMS